MELIAAIKLFFGALITSALSRQVADEFKSWTPWLVQRLIRRAVSRLPEEERERFTEEWQSHVNEIPGEVGKLVVGFGFLHAASKISALCQTPSNLSASREILKRTFDVIFSGAAIALTAPVMCLIGLVIKVTSRGPVFFLQERVGLNGRPFTMYRFRTFKSPMLQRADSIPSNKLFLPTAIGRFLRKTSLDELPQFLNVIKGDMTIVGPRGLPPSLFQQLPNKPSRNGAQRDVKAGITGWAQINRWRKDGSVREPLKDDTYYIQNSNFWFDLRIVCLTLWYGMVGKNDT